MSNQQPNPNDQIRSKFFEIVLLEIDLAFGSRQQADSPSGEFWP